MERDHVGFFFYGDVVISETRDTKLAAGLAQRHQLTLTGTAWPRRRPGAMVFIPNQVPRKDQYNGGDQRSLGTEDKTQEWFLERSGGIGGRRDVGSIRLANWSW